MPRRRGRLGPQRERRDATRYSSPTERAAPSTQPPLTSDESEGDEADVFTLDSGARAPASDAAAAEELFTDAVSVDETEASTAGAGVVIGEAEVPAEVDFAARIAELEARNA